MQTIGFNNADNYRPCTPRNPSGGRGVSGSTVASKLLGIDGDTSVCAILKHSIFCKSCQTFNRLEVVIG